MKRKTKAHLKKYLPRILDLRSKGLGAKAIAKLIPVCKGSIELVIYPNLVIRRKKYYAAKFKESQKKGVCHQCGQKIKFSPKEK